MATAKHAMDRSIARTRAMLQRVLNTLILKKDYEAITIQDICDAANVGRSTFYAHYTSKDDLKRSGLDHLRRPLVDRQRDALAAPGDMKDRGLGFSLAMFEHARDHRDIARWSAAAAAPLASVPFARFFLIWCATNSPQAPKRSPRTRSRANVLSNMLLVLTWPC